jgi:toxin ParE1/3/4
VKSLVFSPRAQLDLAEIWDYTVDRWDVEQADSYLREIVTACEGIASGVRLTRSAESIRPGYRRYTIMSHVIFFKESAEVVDIIRVLHVRMDPSRYLPD